MKGKLKDDKFVKELLYKFLSLLIIAIVALLLLNVMTQNKDGRTQIIDEDGGTEHLSEAALTIEEKKLAEILTGIKGVGDVRVMLSYESKGEDKDFFTESKKEEGGKVKGAVIIASGGDKAVTKSKIQEAVVALFDIPIQNVKVFEGVKEGK